MIQIEQRAVADLRPYPNNPRTNDHAVDAVARSIKEFGFQSPIICDAQMVVICGHTRLKAAAKLGLETVPVIVAEGLTDAQVRALRIADNKTGELAEWDKILLPAELKDLQGLGFDINMLGFDIAELEKYMGAGINGNGGLTDPDDIPLPGDEAITQPGDLWLLGNHRLLCGDSANAEHVDRLLAGAQIHLVSADPPYNVKVEPRSNNAIAAGLSSFPASDSHRGLTHHQSFDLERNASVAKKTTAKMRPKDRPLDNDFVTDEAFDQMLAAWFGNMSRVLVPGGGFYIWGGYANCANYPPVLKACDLYFSQAIIWVKEHPVMTRKCFMGNHEWAFFGWKLGAAHYFNPEIKNARDVWTVKKLTHTQTEHLTQKPVELATLAMTYSSKPGDNVLDLFGGSGSTLIGAEKTGRHAYLMELDTLYADVIVDRWQRFTGRQAILESTGQPFPKAPPATRETMR